MNSLSLPWLEWAIMVSLLGAICVSWISDPFRAYRWGVGFNFVVFGCAFLAWLSFYLGTPFESVDTISLQVQLLERRWLELDDLNAPLVPAVALLHFLTALATARTKMRRFSFAWSLAAEAVLLATFSCKTDVILILLLILGVLPAYVELTNRSKSTRVYLVHMIVYVLLLALSAALQLAGRQGAIYPITAAVLLRCGTFPMHCWITDWFERASMGRALLFTAPLAGVYAAVRLVLPHAPEFLLHFMVFLSLATAVYSAGMAVVQRETRRFLAYLLLGHSSLVLVGLELHTPSTLTGALSLWFSILLSLGGFGLTLRALEARFGHLSLTTHHGLYEHVPTLAVFFLLTGLASIGFPGTLGFVSTEMLVDGAIEANVVVGLIVVAITAFNSIAVLRVYFLLFTGKRHVSTVPLGTTRRERFAVLILTAMILGGGLFPQPGILSRADAARAILADRQAKTANREER